MECKLIKADQEGTESSTDNGGDFFDLLYWFRRTRVDLGSWTRGSSSTYSQLFILFDKSSFVLNEIHNIPVYLYLSHITFHILRFYELS